MSTKRKCEKYIVSFGGSSLRTSKEVLHSVFGSRIESKNTAITGKDLGARQVP